MAAITLYNTLSRRKEPLQTLQAQQVGVYLCGPTVYDDCHIGHLVGPVLFDGIARWLKARHYQVRFVNNITDIDDKIINRSIATGEPWLAITKRYTEQYFQFLKRLKVVTITDHPRCSEYIPQMIAYITDLIAKDRAYLATDGVYYDVQKQDDYGKLSGRRLDEMIAGSRIERDSGLRHPADFCLWKLAKPNEPSWDSPWGKGRPGWHIECSVMATQLLGKTFDIHAGGDDLKFPHHENEIAQAEAHGDGYARCWMHNGLIQHDGAKISKSDPRMQDESFKRTRMIAYLVDTYGAATIRFLLLQGHYRRPSEFGIAHLEAQQTALRRLHVLLGGLMAEKDAPTLDAILAQQLPPALAERRDAFVAAMDDDFNSAQAMAQLFSLAGDVRKMPTAEQHQALRLLRDLGRTLGLFLPGDEQDTGQVASGSDVANAMADIIRVRQTVRAAKDFVTADKIRAALAKAGVVIKDGKDGATWELTAKNENIVADLQRLAGELSSK